jgi:ligand-binding sensor domain-containing protein
VTVAAFIAAAAAVVVHVHTDVGEVRVCAPENGGGGGALVGTGGGLVRVDARGRVKATWTMRDGLPGTRVEAVVRDGADGGWWVGTDGGAAKVRVVAGDLVVDRVVAGAAVNDVVTHGGALYAATAGGVVKLGARGKGVAVPWKGAARGPRVRVAALASHGGALWAGTAGGLFVMRAGRMELVALDGAHASVGVTALYADADADGDGGGGSRERGRLWIATTDGLFVHDAGGMRRVGGGGAITHVTRVGGDVVVAGLGSGLERVDRGRLVRLEGAPRGLALAQAVSEHDGAACAGGMDGLWLRSRHGAIWLEAARPAGPPSNDVSAMAVDADGRLWVGTFDKGLAVRDGSGRWNVVAHPDLDGRINALMVEPGTASRVWVATAAGLMVLDGPDDADVARMTRRDGLPGRGVLSLARLRDGRVIAGTSTGAAIVGGGRVVPVGPAGADIGNVWAVGEDADGMLWLGTTTGVWRGPSTAEGKTARGAEWKRMSMATGHLDDDWVMAIAPRGRSVWIGGYKGGVLRFDLDDLASSARVGAGWVNPGGLTWIGDRLHASTQEGLRVSDGMGGAWETVSGLPGKDVTALVRAGDVSWVSTRRGLAQLAQRAPLAR